MRSGLCPWVPPRTLCLSSFLSSHRQSLASSFPLNLQIVSCFLQGPLKPGAWGLSLRLQDKTADRGGSGFPHVVGIGRQDGVC